MNNSTNLRETIKDFEDTRKKVALLSSELLVGIEPILKALGQHPSMLCIESIEDWGMNTEIVGWEYAYVDNDPHTEHRRQFLYRIPNAILNADDPLEAAKAHRAAELQKELNAQREKQRQAFEEEIAELMKLDGSLTRPAAEQFLRTRDKLRSTGHRYMLGGG